MGFDTIRDEFKRNIIEQTANELYQKLIEKITGSEYGTKTVTVNCESVSYPEETIAKLKTMFEFETDIKISKEQEAAYNYGYIKVEVVDVTA